jgi:manganese transport protein
MDLVESLLGATGLDPTRTLVLSQVVPSLGLPFAVIPLVQCTRRKDIMGGLVYRRSSTFAAEVAATLILTLNVILVCRLLSGGRS